MASVEDPGRRVDLLDDSRSTLRQVEEVLEELGIRETSVRTSMGISLGDLLSSMIRAHREILDLVESLQRSRGIIQKASVERLKNTSLRLQEVSSTTELAASDMLDGLDRALNLLDTLLPGGSGAEPGAAEALRDELHGLISLLQFQDITSQQLTYASGVLDDVEGRLLRILEIFGTDREEGETVDWEAPATADPLASVTGSEFRQALADEIFPGM